MEGADWVRILAYVRLGRNLDDGCFDVLGGCTGGSIGIGCGLFGGLGILGGLVVELSFWYDLVGEACLGGSHEGDH